MTRFRPQAPHRRRRSAAQHHSPDYRRPLKTGNIVQTSVTALMASGARYIVFLRNLSKGRKRHGQRRAFPSRPIFTP